MATRMKTVEYWFPHLATAAEATDQPLTQITVYIPETIVAFRKVTADVVYHDANTTLTYTINRRQITLTLQGASASPVNDTTVRTVSGENYVDAFQGDFTAYFTSNWTGTSRTLDASFLYDTSAGTLGARNISVCVTITYTYDDTSSTHIKTIRVPLNAPVGNVATTKPGSPTAAIPNWSTYLPEGSVTIRQVTTVVQGNTHGAAVDTLLRWQVDALTAFATQLYEHGGTQSMWMRVNQVDSYPTNAAHSWYLWGDVAVWSHMQAWMVVTYEFAPGSTTVVYNSLMLPMEFTSPMGISAAIYQRATRQLWIMEPTTITLKESALFVFWDQAAALTSLNARIGTGSFITYTDTNMATVSGANGLMIVDPGGGAISLARGLNTLQADIYNTSGTNRGMNLGAFWLLNYTSGKASNGVGAHNHTVIRNLKALTGAASVETIVAADAPDIPEATYFLTAVGIRYMYLSNSTGSPCGASIQAERLAAGEGGLQWESVYADIGHTDPEYGLRFAWAQARSLFRRWPADPESDRLPFETARRWRLELGNGVTSFDSLDIIFTYHDIERTVSVTLTNYSGDGSGITVDVYRTSDNSWVRTLTTAIGGTGSFSWYDDVNSIYAVARQSSTKKGRSDDTTGSSLSIDLEPTGSAATTAYTFVS